MLGLCKNFALCHPIFKNSPPQANLEFSFPLRSIKHLLFYVLCNTPGHFDRKMTH